VLHGGYHFGNFLHPLSDCISVRVQLSRQDSIHDHHLPRAAIIRRGEIAPGEKGNLHRLKVSRSDHVHKRPGLLGLRRLGAAFGGVGCRPAHACAFERRTPDGVGGAHTRNHTHAIEGIREEFLVVCVVHLRTRQVNVESQQAVRGKTGIHRVPGHAEVAWVLNGVEFAYARFEVTAIEYNVAG